MGAVSEWAGSILSFLILITVIRGILPSKKYEPYLRLFSGLMLILLVLQPVTGGLGLEKQIDRAFEAFAFQMDHEELNTRVLGIEKERQEQILKIYENDVAGHVTAMAGEQGLQAESAQVEINGDPESTDYGKVVSVKVKLQSGEATGKQEMTFMLRFESDYEEGAHPRVLELLNATNLEQTPGYGEDTYCDEARALIRRACAAPGADVHFLVGGTQTNFIVIESALRPWQGVLCADNGHINVHETGAVEATGHKVLPLPAREGKIDALQIREACAAHYADDSHEHMVQPGMVYISNPSEYGTVYTRNELEALYAACKARHLPLFIDGARLGAALACVRVIGGVHFPRDVLVGAAVGILAGVIGFYVL